MADKFGVWGGGGDTTSSEDTSQSNKYGVWDGLKDFGKNTLGTIQAGLDVVGSLPGLVGASTAAGMQALDTNTRRSFSETMQEIMGSASKGNVMDYVPGSEQNRSNAGYAATNQLLDMPFQGAGNIAGAVANALGSSGEEATKVGEYTHYGTLAATMAAGAFPKGMPKPGTRAFFLEQEKNRVLQSGEDAAKARSTYPEVKPEGPVPPSHTMTDPLGLFSDEQIPIAPEWKDKIRSPYNLPPEEIQRLNQELNPPTEQRVNNQAELFTDYNPVDKFKLQESQPSPLPENRIGNEINPSFQSDPLQKGFSHTQTQFPLEPDIQPGGREGGHFTGQGGASEQSNMSADLFRPGEDMASVNNPGIPYEKDRNWTPEGQAAADVPGFQRTAIESRQARQFNNRQRGNITPGVYLEGLKKILGIVPRSLEAAKYLLESRVQSSMDRRDTVMRPLYEQKLEEVNQQIRGPIQGPPNQRGSVDFSFFDRLTKKEDLEDTAMLHAMNQDRMKKTFEGIRDEVVPAMESLRPILEKSKRLWDEHGIYGGTKGGYDTKWAITNADRLHETLNKITDSSLPIETQNPIQGPHGRHLIAHNMLSGFKEHFAEVKKDLTAYLADIADLRKELNPRSKYDRIRIKQIDSVLNNTTPIKGPKNQRGSIDIKQIAEGVSGLGEKKRLHPRTEITDARRVEIDKIKVKEGPLVAKAISGDTEAFSSLWKKHEPFVFRYLRKLLGDETDAYDALQNTAVKTWRVKDQYNGSSMFRSWLATIAHSEAQMLRRAETHQPPKDMRGQELIDTEHEQVRGDLSPDTPDSILEGKQTQDTMDKAYESLPRDQRTAIQMMLEEMPYKDIAKEMGTSEDNVKQLISRARKGIKEALSGSQVNGPGKYQRGSAMPDPTKLGGMIQDRLDSTKTKKDPLGIKKLKELFLIEDSKKPIADVLGIKSLPEQQWDNKNQVSHNVLDPASKKAVDALKDIGIDASFDFKLFSLNPKGNAGKILSDTQNAILSQSKNPVVIHTVNNNRLIEQRKMNAIESAEKGDTYKKGFRGWDVREWGKDGMFTEWHQMYSKNWRSILNPELREKYRQGRAELMEMKDIWLNAHMTGQDPVFRTERQQRIFDTIQKQLDKALDAYNAARKLIDPTGKIYPQIEKITNYFPSLWMGDYRFVIKGNEGQILGYYARDTMSAANKAVSEVQKSLREKFPNETFSIEPPEHVSRPRENGSRNTDQMMATEASRLWGQDDPRVAAIREVMGRLSAKQGFGNQRGIKKTFIDGFMGSEKGDRGLQDAHEALRSYVERMYTATANLERRDLSRSLMALPQEVHAKIPQTMKLMDDFLAHASGGNLAEMFKGVDELFERTSMFFGQGASGAYKALTATKSTVITMMLATGKFAFSQVFQPASIIARLTKGYMFEEMRNPLVAGFKGYEHSIPGLADESAKQGMNYLTRNGYTESAMVELANADIASGKNKITDRIKTLSGITLGKLEKEVVKIPVFLSLEYALRDSIKLPEERYRTAAEMMRHYMVPYDLASSPMVFNHMGDMVGGSAKPLKQFAINYIGTFAEYIHDLSPRDIKSAAPLAAFIGMGLLVGGIKGTMGVNEIDSAIRLLNSLGKDAGWEPIPTIQELAYRHGASDAMVFGGASVLSGQDMTSSVGAATTGGLFSFPIADYTGKLSADAADYAWLLAHGVAKTEHQMQVAMDAAPPALKASVEEYYTKNKGDPVPSPAHGMQGNYVRSERDKWVGQMFGGRSIAESKANTEASNARSDIKENSESRKTAISAIADRLYNGDEVSASLLERYVHEGGSVSGLLSSVKEEMKHRQLMYMEEQMAKKPSPGQARNMEFLQHNQPEAPQQKTGSNKYGVW